VTLDNNDPDDDFDGGMVEEKIVQTTEITGLEAVKNQKVR